MKKKSSLTDIFKKANELYFELDLQIQLGWLLKLQTLKIGNWTSILPATITSQAVIKSM